MSKLKRNLLIATLATIILCTLALIAIVTHVGSISDPYMNEQIINKNTFEGQWPFAVNDVVIRCDDIEGESLVSLITPTGITYSLNAITDLPLSNKDSKWQPLSPQSDIWINMTTVVLDANNAKNIKVPMSDIITAGLTLCDIK